MAHLFLEISVLSLVSTNGTKLGLVEFWGIIGGLDDVSHDVIHSSCYRLQV